MVLPLLTVSRQRHLINHCLHLSHPAYSLPISLSTHSYHNILIGIEDAVKNYIAKVKINKCYPLLSSCPKIQLYYHEKHVG